MIKNGAVEICVKIDKLNITKLNKNFFHKNKILLMQETR